MATVKEMILLNTTPENAWSFVIETEKLIKWKTDIRKFEMIDKGDPEVGKRFYIQKEIRGGLQRFDCTIMQVEENRRFAFEAEAAGFARVDAVYEIIPEGDGCKFIINETVDVLNMKFLKPFFDKVFIQRGLSKTIRGFLANLESMIENS